MRKNSGYSILQAYTRINYSSPIGGFECHAEIYSSQVIIADKGMHDIQAFSLRSSYTPTGQGRNKLVGPTKPQALGSTTGIQGQRTITILIVRCNTWTGRQPYAHGSTELPWSRTHPRRRAQQGCESGSITQTTVPELNGCQCGTKPN